MEIEHEVLLVSVLTTVERMWLHLVLVVVQIELHKSPFGNLVGKNSSDEIDPSNQRKHDEDLGK